METQTPQNTTNLRPELPESNWFSRHKFLYSLGIGFLIVIIIVLVFYFNRPTAVSLIGPSGKLNQESKTEIEIFLKELRNQGYLPTSISDDYIKFELNSTHCRNFYYECINNDYGFVFTIDKPYYKAKSYENKLNNFITENKLNDFRVELKKLSFFFPHGL